MGKIADSYVEVGLNQAKLDENLKDMEKKVNDTAQKSKAAMSRALLDVSRGVQDFAAAGLMGIVNNVEGIARNIATAMGGSAVKAGAIAGGLTLVAVAAQMAMPVIKSLAEETSKFFGIWRSESEKVRTSVEGMMDGGSGLKAMTAELQKQAEFLKGRTDEVGGWNIDFISRAMGLKSIDEKARENNERRAIEASALMSRSFELASEAARQLAAAQRGATAKFDLTTGQAAGVGLNKQLFQSAVDKFGGGDNLRTKIQSEARQKLGMNKTQSRELYGMFASGDNAATARVESILNLTAERTKIMADDFEKATGAAQELSRIEGDKIRRAAEFEKSQIKWMEQQTQKASADLIRLPEEQAKAEERLASFERDREEKMRRSFDYQSLSDARDKLFMGARDNKKDELTADKMKGEIDRIVKALDKLNVKWGMQ